MPSGSSDSSIKTVARDLLRVAQRDWTASTEPVPELPTLHRIAADLQLDIRSSDRWREILLRRGIAKLSGRPNGIHQTWQWIANQIFFPDPAALAAADDSKHYSKVVSALLKQITYTSDDQARSGRTQRRNIQTECRTRVARALLSLDQDARPSTSEPELATETVRRSTVARPEIEAQLLSSVDDGVPMVVLWGESGNGKTYLATETLTTKYGPNRVLLLRGPAIGGDSAYHRDLVAALHRVGCNTETWDFLARQQKLLSTLESDEYFAVAILDDFTLDQVSNLLSGQEHLPIVVTTHYHESATKAIHVPPYSNEQALVAARPLLNSHAESSNVSRLCDTLGNRPLAISLASGLVELGYVSVNGLIDACQDDPDGLLKAGEELLGLPAPSSLTRLYSYATTQLSTDDEYVMRVLSTLCWVSSVTIFTALCQFATGEANVPASEQLKIRAALLKLARVGILTFDKNEAAVNELAVRLMRRHLAHHMDATISRAWALMTSDATNDKLSEKTLTVEIFDSWMVHVLDLAFMVTGFRWLITGRMIGNDEDPPYELYLILLSAHTWYICQNNVAVFDIGDGPRQVAMIEVTPFAAFMWRTDGPRPLSRSEARIFYALVWFYRVTVHAGLSDLQSKSAGPSPWLLAHNNQSHLPLVRFMSKFAAAEAHMPIWARCGRQYIPKVIQNGEQVPDCEECWSVPDIDTGGQAEALEVLMSAIYLTRMLRDSGLSTCDGLYVQLLTTRAFVLLESGRPSEAFRHFEEAIEVCNGILTPNSPADLRLTLMYAHAGALMCAIRLEQSHDIWHRHEDLRTTLKSLNLRSFEQVHLWRALSSLAIKFRYATVAYAAAKEALSAQDASPHRNDALIDELQDLADAMWSLIPPDVTTIHHAAPAEE